jgi:hypothetical protein
VIRVQLTKLMTPVAFIMLLGLFCAKNIVGQERDQPSSTWTYQSEGTLSTHVSLQPIWLSKTRPDDLVIADSIDHADALYGQFQYGSFDSRSIAIVMVRHNGKSDLYVDFNRDRAIRLGERIEGPRDTKSWQFNLQSEYPGEEVDTWKAQDREVAFRLSDLGEFISYQTVGCLTGKLQLEQSASDETRFVDAQVFDNDGNGRFGDAEDLVLYDADGDGEFNRFTEKTNLVRGITLLDKRYMLLSNQAGTSISARLRKGFGKVHIVLESPAEVISARMLLVSRDGITVPIEAQVGDNASAEVPAGEYRVTSLYLALKDKQEQKRWNYTFSSYYIRSNSVWSKVKADEEIKIVPLADLKFSLSTGAGAAKQKPGAVLSVRPMLITGSGMIINNCWQGDASQASDSMSKGATIRLLGTPSDPPMVATSGFR